MLDLFAFGGRDPQARTRQQSVEHCCKLIIDFLGHTH